MIISTHLMLNRKNLYGTFCSTTDTASFDDPNDPPHILKTIHFTFSIVALYRTIISYYVCLFII